MIERTPVSAIQRGRAWLHAHRLQLLMSGFSVLLVFVCSEAAIRVLGSSDEDGNFTFSGRRLRPYQLPVKRVASAVQRYKQATDTMIVYDPELGWSPRPSARNNESVHNAAGLRVEAATHDIKPAPTPGVFRIALFGDSFVYGSEVGYPDTWAFGLARRLQARGEAVEVLNFGVPGYGTDQAYLRWIQAGAAYAPDVVIFGLQLENMHRNVNLIRPLYIPVVDLPFSKPRFVEDQSGWQLINRPAMPPERLTDVLQRFDQWELHDEEEFYNPEQYESKWWLRSRLLAVTIPTLLERAGAVPREDELTPEKQALTFRILSEFAQRVEERGARLVVLHLPTRSDLQTLISTGELPLPNFLGRVRTRFGLVDPAADLVRKSTEVSMPDLFRPGGHYTAAGNAVVADRLASQLKHESP
jgi:hypothetical protein